MKHFLRQVWPLILLVIVGLILWHTLMAQGAPSAQASRVARLTGTATVSGSTVVDENISFLAPPRLSAAFLNRVLDAYRSPAAGLGSQIYGLGRQYGINSDLLMAIFGNESRFGTTGEARVSRSVGNLRCLDVSYAPYHPSCADGYAQFPSWVDGMGAFYRLLKVGYIEGLVTIPAAGHRCTTLAQVIPVWAPVADGNNPAGYIRNVLTFLRAWYAGRVRP
jgi:hypothetical protein